MGVVPKEGTLLAGGYGFPRRSLGALVATSVFCLAIVQIRASGTGRVLGRSLFSVENLFYFIVML